MGNSIIEFVKQCPDATVALKLGDVKELVVYCLLEAKKEFETNEVSEQYLTRKQAAQKLNVDLSSLWRYDKRSYLTPVKVGGKRLYKLSDVERILKKGRA